MNNTPSGVTLRTWLIFMTIDATGVDYGLAAEAVASTALEHPEWDMSERRSWMEWAREWEQQQRNRGTAS